MFPIRNVLPATLLLLAFATQGIGEPVAPNDPASNESLPQETVSFLYRLFNEAVEASTGENLLVSPIGPAAALSMLANAAGGDTQEAMRRAFGVASEAELNTAFQGILKSLPAHADGVELALANSLWVRKDVGVASSFAGANADFYGAALHSLDFSDAGAPEEINTWVRQATHGRIPSLIEEPIDENTILFLLSATYFKGLWSIPFDAEKTQGGEFIALDGEKRMIPMMKHRAKYAYSESDAGQTIELPYADGRYTMLVHLPKDSLESMCEVTPEYIADLRGRAKQNEVVLQIPRFKMESRLDLNEPLIQMGMGVAFDPSLADFGGLTDPPRSDLFIRKVLHKTCLIVDESGSEAAAATSVEVATRESGGLTK